MIHCPLCGAVPVLGARRVGDYEDGRCACGALTYSQYAISSARWEFGTAGCDSLSLRCRLDDGASGLTIFGTDVGVGYGHARPEERGTAISRAVDVPDRAERGIVVGVIES